MALQTDWSVQAGLQAFFRMSRQISPVCKARRQTESEVAQRGDGQ